MTENTLKKLAQLLEQDQFELIFSEKIQKEDLTSKQVIEKIIGFTFDGTSGITFPLYADIYEDLSPPVKFMP